MRENRPYGLEGGETGSTGLPYPYAELDQTPSDQNLSRPETVTIHVTNLLTVHDISRLGV